jgi:hypothetical protein
MYAATRYWWHVGQRGHRLLNGRHNICARRTWTLLLESAVQLIVCDLAVPTGICLPVPRLDVITCKSGSLAPEIIVPPLCCELALPRRMADQGKDIPDEHRVPRTADWLSRDVRHHHDWLGKTVKHVDANPPDALHPALQEFKEKVESSSRLRMLFAVMYDQIPRNKGYLTDPAGEKATVRNFDHMLALLNHVLTTAPAWTDAGHSVGLVGVPINALLDWPMATRSGFTVFQDPEVNGMLKKVLDAWGTFLQSPESAYVLGTEKTMWFGEKGRQSLMDVANNGQTNYTFEEIFVCDPDAPNHGYKSWDDFVSCASIWASIWPYV